MVTFLHPNLIKHAKRRFRPAFGVCSTKTLVKICSSFALVEIQEVQWGLKAFDVELQGY